MDIADRLRTLRLALGVTKTQAAHLIGVTRLTYAKWEEGEIKEMGFDKLKRAAQAYGCTMDFMVGINHWTFPHIRPWEGKWVALDESGQEHGRYDTQADARDALILYNGKLKDMEYPPTY